MSWYGKPIFMAQAAVAYQYLDGLSPLYAVSRQKLFSAYAGPCCRVQRQTDHAQQDIGWVGNYWDEDAIEAFSDGDTKDVHLQKWHNQSPVGAGKDFVNNGANENSMPVIYEAGVGFRTVGSRAAPDGSFNLGDFLFQNTTDWAAVSPAMTICCAAKNVGTISAHRCLTGIEGVGAGPLSSTEFRVKHNAAAHKTFTAAVDPTTLPYTLTWRKEAHAAAPPAAQRPISTYEMFQNGTALVQSSILNPTGVMALAGGTMQLGVFNDVNSSTGGAGAFGETLLTAVVWFQTYETSSLALVESVLQASLL